MASERSQPKPLVLFPVLPHPGWGEFEFQCRLRYSETWRTILSNASRQWYSWFLPSLHLSPYSVTISLYVFRRVGFPPQLFESDVLATAFVVLILLKHESQCALQKRMVSFPCTRPLVPPICNTQVALNNAAGFDLEKGGSRREQKVGRKRP